MNENLDLTKTLKDAQRELNFITLVTEKPTNRKSLVCKDWKYKYL